MGIESPITVGGLFPEQAPKGDMTIETLVAHQVAHGQYRNHPSFALKHCQDTIPGVALVTEYTEHGFGILFESREAAEQWLVCGAFPAP